jgi:hypothetical protein
MSGATWMREISWRYALWVCDYPTDKLRIPELMIPYCIPNFYLLIFPQSVIPYQTTPIFLELSPITPRINIIHISRLSVVLELPNVA